MNITLNAFTATVIASLVIPLLTGLVTKSSASDKVKAGVALALSILAGAFVTAVQPDGTAVISQSLIQNTFLTLVMQVGTYLGIYKPILDVNSKLMPHKGLG